MSSLKQQTMSGVFWQFMQKMLGQIITFTVSVVLARLILPSDYGTVALAGMYMLLLAIFIDCGLGAALIQKKEVDDLDLSTIFWAQLLFAIIIYTIVFFSAPYFSVMFKDDRLTPILRVSALILPLGTLSTIQTSIISRKMAFKTYFYTTFVSSLLSGIIGIIMAFRGYGAWALVGQNMSSSIIGTLAVYFQVRWLPSFKFSKERFLGLFSYGWKFSSSSFLGTIFFQLRGYIIGFYYTSADLAFYNRGEGIPGIINRNISGTVSSVLFPVLTKLQDDKIAVKRALSRSMKTCSYLMMPLLFGLAAISDKLVVLLYTERWSQCVPFMQVICVMELFNLLSMANLQALNAIGKADVVLKLEIYKKPPLVLILIITAMISPLAICVGMLIYSLWAFIVNAFPNRKLISYPIKEQLKDVVENVLLSFIMVIVVVLLGRLLPFSDMIIIGIQIIIGIATYILSSILMKNESYLYLKCNLKSYYLKKKTNTE